MANLRKLSSRDAISVLLAMGLQDIGAERPVTAQALAGCAGKAHLAQLAGPRGQEEEGWRGRRDCSVCRRAGGSLGQAPRPTAGMRLGGRRVPTESCQRRGCRLQGMARSERISLSPREHSPGMTQCGCLPPARPS